MSKGVAKEQSPVTGCASEYTRCYFSCRFRVVLFSWRGLTERRRQFVAVGLFADLSCLKSKESTRSARGWGEQKAKPEEFVCRMRIT